MACLQTGASVVLCNHHKHGAATLLLLRANFPRKIQKSTFSVCFRIFWKFNDKVHSPVTLSNASITINATSCFKNKQNVLDFHMTKSSPWNSTFQKNKTNFDSGFENYRFPQAGMFNNRSCSLGWIGRRSQRVKLFLNILSNKLNANNLTKHFHA